MPRRTESARSTRLIGAFALMACTAGCAQVDDWLRRDGGRSASDPATADTSQDADRYLQDMYRVASADPATQAELFADAETSATLTPGPSTRLRYALLLATPGHAESNPEQAQDLLRDVLSQAELLTTAEIALATVHLADIEQRLMLDRETSRLRAASSQTASTERRAIEQRIARIEAENRELRESLAEAEQKLEAITTIERSIREQSDNGNTPP